MSSTNRGSDRLESDFYPTPLYSLEPLISRINFDKVNSFLEPCKGDGRILDLIPDKISKQWCEIREGVDYLISPLFNIDLIITNPPFSISLDFINKSLLEAKTVCYLQRLNWLGSQTRKDFWNNNPPDKLFILSKRPQFKKELGYKGGTDSTEYAWFIWDKLNIIKGNLIEVL